MGETCSSLGGSSSWGSPTGQMRCVCVCVCVCVCIHKAGDGHTQTTVELVMF